MTYGEVRAQLTRLCPDAGLDLLDAWIRARYEQILTALPWTRLEKRTVIPFAGEHKTGTVSATKGGTTITGNGTTWTSDMTYRAIRIGSGREYYQFTWASATSATLDRPYEGETIADTAYSIQQIAVPLPADCRVIANMQVMGEWWVMEARALPPSWVNGPPRWYAPFIDSVNGAPQIEIWPRPLVAGSLVVNYAADASTSSASSQALLPWVQSGCIVAGVQADHAAWKGVESVGNIGSVQMFEARFQTLLAQMVAAEARNRPPVHIGIADRYTRHRLARAWR